MYSRWILVSLGLAVACSRATPERASGAHDDFGTPIPAHVAGARIVSLSPVTTELLFALGVGSRLVGRTHWDGYPAAALAVPDVGDGIRPNVEAILAQRPDLVLLYASEENRNAATSLSAAGVTALAWRVDRPADLWRLTSSLGSALGVSLAAAALIDSVQRSLDAARGVADTLPPLRAFWHVWDRPVITIGAGSYLSELLALAGGANVFGDVTAPSIEVSLEEVVRRNPDVILAGPTAARAMAASEGWRTVRAVREGRILVVDTALVGRPGPRLGEAARHLRALLDSARRSRL